MLVGAGEDVALGQGLSCRLMPASSSGDSIADCGPVQIAVIHLVGIIPGWPPRLACEAALDPPWLAAIAGCPLQGQKPAVFARLSE